MKEHTRIVTSVNPPMSFDELKRILIEELEKIIMDKGSAWHRVTKEDRNERMKAVITDMTTIMIRAAGEKQKSEIAEAGGKLYTSVRRELADEVWKALKYDELSKEGLTDVDQVKQMKEAANRTEAAEDMLEFSWPGVTKAKNILISPELDKKYMTANQRNDIVNILYNNDDHPEERISDMLRLLKYASSFRKISLATQAEALMLSVDKAVTYIKDYKGCDFIGGANNMMATIENQVEKPAEAVNQIAATAACLFFGFVDAATTISTGSGGGGGGDSELPKKKDDENDRQFAARCLLSAAQMRLPARGMKKGR